MVCARELCRFRGWVVQRARVDGHHTHVRIPDGYREPEPFRKCPLSAKLVRNIRQKPLGKPCSKIKLLSDLEGRTRFEVAPDDGSGVSFTLAIE